MKKCSKCGLEKPETEFRSYAKSSDGLFSWCKECCRANDRARYKADPSKKKESAREWAEKNPERRAEVAKQATKRYYGRNKSKAYQATVRWKQANPEKVAAQDRRRKLTRKRTVKQAITGWDADLDTLVELEADDLRSRRTQMTGFAWQVDHVVPLKALKVSGLHNAYNLAVVPGSYNARKKNTFYESMLHIREWL